MPDPRLWLVRPACMRRPIRALRPVFLPLCCPLNVVPVAVVLGAGCCACRACCKWLCCACCACCKWLCCACCP